MIDFKGALAYVLAWEGGLEENAADPAGITNQGISLRFLKSLSPETLKSYSISSQPDADTIRNLTYPQVKAIYFGEFWSQAPFDKINSQEITNYLFDQAVNCGIAPAVKCIQRACWAVARQVDNPIADGILGNRSLDLINHCAFYLLPALRAERAAYYRSLVAANASLSQFLDGWLRRSYNSTI